MLSYPTRQLGSSNAASRSMGLIMMYVMSQITWYGEMVFILGSGGIFMLGQTETSSIAPWRSKSTLLSRSCTTSKVCTLVGWILHDPNPCLALKHYILAIPYFACDSSGIFPIPSYVALHAHRCLAVKELQWGLDCMRPHRKPVLKSYLVEFGGCQPENAKTLNLVRKRALWSGM